MSRTRLDAGATVVRVDAISWVSAQEPAFWIRKGVITVRPAESLCPICSGVNQIGNRFNHARKQCALFLSKQLFTILNKADEHHYGGPQEANEKHHFKQSHCINRHNHMPIVA